MIFGVVFSVIFGVVFGIRVNVGFGMGFGMGFDVDFGILADVRLTWGSMGLNVGSLTWDSMEALM